MKQNTHISNVIESNDNKDRYDAEAQLDTEFVPPQYNAIKKVYSVWICMDAPNYAAYTITRYHMCREDLYGHLKKEPRYNLMEVVMVCLGKEKNKGNGNRLHKMLSTLFSPTLQPKEKEHILEQDYDIETSVELEGGFQTMCNLSQGIENKGIEKGRSEGLSALVHTLKEFIPDFDTLYEKVIQNEGFESLTKEEVLKYY